MKPRRAERHGAGGAGSVGMYLAPDGRLYTISGVAHMEDEHGVITIPTTDEARPLVFTRANIRGQIAS